MNNSILNNSSAEYETVIIVGVDGAGAFFKNVDTPNFDRIFESGKYTYKMHSAFPTSSAENWGAMFYGVEPLDHGLNEAYALHRHYYDPHLRSVFWHVHNKYPSSNIASIVGWIPINTGIIELEDGMYKYPNQIQEELNGDEIVENFRRYLCENEDIKLIYIQLEDVDKAGHKYGWGTSEYYDVLKDADKNLGEIYDCIEEYGKLDRTLFIVVADHGGTINKCHGGNSLEEVESFFAIRGDNTNDDEEIEDIQTRDIGAIVLQALGIDIPDYFTGRIPKGIWKEIGGGVRKESMIEKKVSPLRSIHKEKSPFQYYDRVLKKSILYYNGFDNETKEGIFGHCLDCSESPIPVECKCNKDAITIAFWIKVSDISDVAVIVSNKDWTSRLNRGFVIAQRPNDILIHIGDGKDSMAVKYPLPFDYKEGWTHFIFSIDLKNRIIDGYRDFEEIYIDTINPELDIADVLLSEHMMIGQDITGKYPKSLDAMIDDFIILDHRLRYDEVEILKSVYIL